MRQGSQRYMLTCRFTGLSYFPLQFTHPKYSHQKQPTSCLLPFQAYTIFGSARLSLRYNKSCLTSSVLCVHPSANLTPSISFSPYFFLSIYFNFFFFVLFLPLAFSSSGVIISERTFLVSNLPVLNKLPIRQNSVPTATSHLSHWTEKQIYSCVKHT